MRSIRSLFFVALVIGGLAILALAACDGATSPTAPAATGGASPPASAEAAGGQAGSSSVAGAARQSRVDLCHRTGNGRFESITVAEAAVAAHLAHGDVAPGTGGLDSECRPSGPTATPEPTAEPTPEVTPEMTPEVTPEVTGEPTEPPPP